MRDLLTFRAIPLDACPRCPAGTAVGVAVAIAGQSPEVTIRQVCPACHLVWDTSWNADAFPHLRPFDDARVLARDGQEAHANADATWPAGPSGVFRRAGAALETSHAG